VTGSKLFKPNVKRLRPSHTKKLEKDIHLLIKKDGTHYKGGTYGYFSSHASTTFCLATFLILLFKRRHKSILLLIIWSVSIGYSRIYLGVHYPLDVITGFLFGFLYAYLGVKLLKRSDWL
jgi:undecaprenyl-diphosphatase